MTCKCNDNIKIFTIGGTAFEAAKTSGGELPVKMVKS